MQRMMLQCNTRLMLQRNTRLLLQCNTRLILYCDTRQDSNYTHLGGDIQTFDRVHAHNWQNNGGKSPLNCLWPCPSVRTTVFMYVANKVICS